MSREFDTTQTSEQEHVSLLEAELAEAKKMPECVRKLVKDATEFACESDYMSGFILSEAIAAVELHYGE